MTFRIYAKTAEEGLLIRVGRPHATVNKAIARAMSVRNATSIEIRQTTPRGGEVLVHAFDVKENMPPPPVIQGFEVRA